MRKKSVHAPRPKYHDKTEVVLKAVKRLVYQEKQRNQRYSGFTMAQIAEEAGYARSQRFMETLYSMCDDGLLKKTEWVVSDHGIKNRVEFCLPPSVKQTSFAS